MPPALPRMLLFKREFHLSPNTKYEVFISFTSIKLRHTAGFEGNLPGFNSYNLTG